MSQGEDQGTCVHTQLCLLLIKTIYKLRSSYLHQGKTYESYMSFRICRHVSCTAELGGALSIFLFLLLLKFIKYRIVHDDF